MLGYAILMTFYSQTNDNVIEPKYGIYENNRLCLEQGEELVRLTLKSKPANGKTIRSAWFTCQTVRGAAAHRMAAPADRSRAGRPAASR